METLGYLGKEATGPLGDRIGPVLVLLGSLLDVALHGVDRVTHRLADGIRHQEMHQLLFSSQIFVLNFVGLARPATAAFVMHAFLFGLGGCVQIPAPVL